MGVTLLSCWVSPYGMRCEIAMAEKGVEYEFKKEDVMQKSPLLLQSNPVHKMIPVLLHDGNPICESLNIVTYIEEAWPDRAPLLPPASDPFARAQARFWADFIDKKVIGCGMRIWKNKGEATAEAAKEFVEALKVLEGELGEKKYLGGEAFGLADVALAPLVAWSYSFEKCGGFSMEAEAPRVVAWGKRCMARDSVAKALPDPHKVYDFVCYLRKMFGFE